MPDPTPDPRATLELLEKIPVATICFQATGSGATISTALLRRLEQYVALQPSIIRDLRRLVELEAKCDGRADSFLKLLEERAKELQPDYPYSKHDAFEWLWALTSGLEGTNLANDDLHKRLNALAHREGQ